MMSAIDLDLGVWEKRPKLIGIVGKAEERPDGSQCWNSLRQYYLFYKIFKHKTKPTIKQET